MFTNAHNFIATGQFEFHTGKSGFERLFDYTTPDAAYGSYVTDSRASCVKGTRTRYIEDITGWGDGTNRIRQQRLMWMYGPAGVGKSAVAKSCAEFFARLKLLGASFFLSRDKRLNDPRRLFTTIAYQIAAQSPEYKRILGLAIENDSNLLSKGLRAQFQALLVAPFLELFQRGVSIESKVVVVDGLDECDGGSRSAEEAQVEIVDIVMDAVAQYGSKIPLLWAIFSRPEKHIVDAFSKCSHSLLWKVELPISRSHDGDIRLYFCNALRQYPGSSANTSTSSSIKAAWPSENELDTLVKMVAGLFIYAATVVRFILDRNALGPRRQLASVLTFYSDIQHKRSAEPRTGQSVTTELDSFYSMIMGCVPPNLLPIVQQILLIYHTKPVYPIRIHAYHLGISLEELRKTLERLHSVLKIIPQEAWIDMSFGEDEVSHPRSGTISIYHASFMEYLVDRNRSERYWIRDPRHYTNLVKEGIHLRNDLYALNGTSRTDKISQLRKLLQAFPSESFTQSQSLKSRDALLKYLEDHLLEWCIYAGFGSDILEQLEKAELDNVRRNPLKIGYKLERSLIPEDIRTAIKRSEALERWQNTELPWKWDLALGDEPSQPHASAAIEEIWAYIKSTLFVFRDPEFFDDFMRLIGKEQNLDDLDDFDLVSYYSQQWVMYYWGRNICHLDSSDVWDAPSSITRAALSPWAGFLNFMEGDNHRLTKAVLGILGKKRNGDVIESLPIPASYAYLTSIRQLTKFNLTASEEHFRIQYCLMTMDYSAAEPAFRLDRDLLFNLKEVAGRLREEEASGYSLLPQDCFMPLCVDILMRDHWEELYAQYEKTLKASDDSAVNYCRIIWGISRHHPDASHRVTHLSRNSIKRLATAAINKVASSGMQPSENPDFCAALLLDLAKEQTKKIQAIALLLFDGGYGIVAGALQELVPDHPEWHDVVEDVCVQHLKEGRDRTVELQNAESGNTVARESSDADSSSEESSSTHQQYFSESDGSKSDKVSTGDQEELNTSETTIGLKTSHHPYIPNTDILSRAHKRRRSEARASDIQPAANPSDESDTVALVLQESVLSTAGPQKKKERRA
ncbi:hypothetical protein NP233_g1114 [Leucocoprinus birnbaumii]|uniref:Nephrocystin 3-like N-terminal domain-containing protein n=1 Tax=Leucocoprinus birnbaumii TaxID=56174 RepID=A0AAD5YZV2_9AGAR|nr:hypothetical protein NP233_g1114 [Leucocoprinus birnbaumii]